MGAESRRHADRARQFMPFASLRGYYDFIREQERVKEPRRELSEDDAQELSDVLGKTARGVMLRVVFYDRITMKRRRGWCRNLTRCSGACA